MKEVAKAELILELSFFNDFRGIAAHDHPGFDVFDHDGSRGDDSAFSHGDAWSYKCPGANPGFPVHGNGHGHEGQAGLGVVVRSGAEVGFL